MLTALQASLTDALEEEIIDTSPVLRRDKLLGKQLRKQRKTIEIFMATELQSMLEASLQLRPIIFPIVLTMARTGLRVGEALALQIGDVDFSRNQIRVNRTWIRYDSGREERFNIPKNGSVRIVDMSQQLAETLQGYMEKCQPTLWLFPLESGSPLDPYTFRGRYWRKLFAMSSVTYRSPHTLRHTYATHLILRGESLPYIQTQLGHRSISTTVDVYGHLLGMQNPGITDHLDDETIRNPYATRQSERLRLVKGD